MNLKPYSSNLFDLMMLMEMFYSTTNTKLTFLSDVHLNKNSCNINPLNKHNITEQKVAELFFACFNLHPRLAEILSLIRETCVTPFHVQLNLILLLEGESQSRKSTVQPSPSLNHVLHRF
jgi:hypothetical protein